MESEWDWKKNKRVYIRKGDNYEIWNIWWTICTTRIKKRIR